MEINGMTYMTDAERKILPQIVEYPERILQLKNAPSEEFLRAAARKQPYIIRFVHNQSYALRKIAVETDGMALQYVNGVTPELELIAVRQNPDAIQFIKNPTNAVLREYHGLFYEYNKKSKSR